MRTVPRHRLLTDIWVSEDDGSPGRNLQPRTVDPVDPDEEALNRIYSNVPIVTRVTDGRPSSSTSQPSLVAQMLELLALKPGMRILEIGAGTGYNAALLAEIVGDQKLVTSIDIQPDVVEQTQRLLDQAGYGDIEILCADGALGHPDGAPFDRVVATVGCSDIAPAWLDQLAPSGFAVIPLEHVTVGHPLTRLQPAGSGATGRVVAAAGFMRIQGALQVPGPRRDWAGIRQGEERRRPVPPELAPFAGAWSGPSWDFLYYLRLVDPRSGPGLLLVDAGGSLRVEYNGSELSETGDSEHLLAALFDHIKTWEALGRPAASDWHSRFSPIEGDVPDDARHWVDRIHYAQLASLQVPVDRKS